MLRTGSTICLCRWWSWTCRKSNIFTVMQILKYRDPRFSVYGTNDGATRSISISSTILSKKNSIDGIGSEVSAARSVCIWRWCNDQFSPMIARGLLSKQEEPIKSSIRIFLQECYSCVDTSRKDARVAIASFSKEIDPGSVWWAASSLVSRSPIRPFFLNT